MQRNNRRLRIFAAVVLVVIEVVCVSIGVLYIIHSTLADPEFANFYFYQVTMVIMLGSAFDVAGKLIGVERRLDLVVEYQKRILREIREEVVSGIPRE